MTCGDHRTPFYLGIDLGGTNIKAGVVDDLGRPLSSISIETNAKDGPVAGIELLAKAGDLAVQASRLTWDEIAHVGLGSPGTMDIQAGMLLELVNLPGWVNIPICKLLTERLKKSTILQNDANAAAFGEFWVGAGRGMRSLVMLTLGTGIGGGLINEGKIVEGSHSHAAECGHIVIQMDGGRPCTCGRSGHLEAYASATSLVKRAEEALGRETGSLLYNELERGQLTSQAIHHAAEAGDALAQRLMAETARYLAIGATTMMLAINPDMIVFGGGMIAAGSKFLEAIQAHVHGLTFPIPAQKTRIAFAELGGDAGFIGAAGCARMAHQAGTTAPTPSR